VKGLANFGINFLRSTTRNLLQIAGKTRALKLVAICRLPFHVCLLLVWLYIGYEVIKMMEF
jgi:hypothetical protein